MRGYVNSSEIKQIVVFGLVILPMAVLFYENKLNIGHITSVPLFLMLLLMLITRNIEIPIASIRTRKPELLSQHAFVLEKIYSVPVSEELITPKERVFDTKLTINFGGVIIPLLAIIYLLVTGPITTSLEIALIITVIAFLSSEIIDGVGIEVPDYIGLVSLPLTLLLSTGSAESVIFISSIIGIIAGCVASLLTLDREQNGSAYISIGGVGSFRAIYIMALIASLLSYYT
ncbi:MAG: hypothetical protein A4E24_01292 [Methanomethylovorans sp. PtaU1.Bin093]|uniref:DUF1614 domain-containing protein n=1 Tax=Methanomethylovorans sp. PtaU1.Bin093 TaxID=1811679 RepID=UPI0009CDF641|nr:DUF1614 domain-containing protein [Methanomethylovorans sp. PtaU1.Bin093]OPY20366.1 MAG: hypothetical protein A4E24_01292 [Methanomethylovorans sp. PtaU1.Bin093]